MAWKITQADIDYSENKALVTFTDGGGSEAYPRSVSVHFSIGAPGDTMPENVDENALLAQAKQIMTDAASSG